MNIEKDTYAEEDVNKEFEIDIYVFRIIFSDIDVGY